MTELAIVSSESFQDTNDLILMAMLNLLDSENTLRPANMPNDPLLPENEFGRLEACACA